MISIYWFLVLVIVACGVVFMVLKFNSGEFDVREMESMIFTRSVSDCILSSGKILVDFESDSETFWENCNIDFFGGETDLSYYAHVWIYDLDLNLVFEVSGGNTNYYESCFLKFSDESLQVCREERYYGLLNDQQYLVKVLTGVGKSEESL